MMLTTMTRGGEWRRCGGERRESLLQEQLRQRAKNRVLCTKSNVDLHAYSGWINPLLTRIFGGFGFKTVMEF